MLTAFAISLAMLFTIVTVRIACGRAAAIGFAVVMGTLGVLHAAIAAMMDASIAGGFGGIFVNPWLVTVTLPISILLLLGGCAAFLLDRRRAVKEQANSLRVEEQ